MRVEISEVWIGRAAAALILMAVLAGCATDPLPGGGESPAIMTGGK